MIRAAQPTDAGAVGAILSAFIDSTDWMPRLYSRAEELAFAGLMIERGWVIVAQPEGHVVAGFMAREAEYIHALYVAQGWRGQGIGRAMLDHAKARCRALELRSFQQNMDAQAFYARQGFRAAEKGDGTQNDEGLPDIRLIWERTSDEQ